VPPVAPLLLTLDGNSLLHRAYHAAATGFLLDADDRPVWAIKGLIGYLARAAARLRPHAVLVGFDCPDSSVRKTQFPHYKAHRPDKAADLAEQILAAPGLLRAAGVPVAVPAGLEADDVLASAAAHARAAGWRSVLMTSDRDAFALIDATTSVLRVRNGGFDEAVTVTPDALAGVYGVTPQQYRDYAAMRGDPADNLRGVPGVGGAKSAALIAAFGDVDAVWAAVDRGDLDALRAVVERNRVIMAMHADVPLPDIDRLRLPLDRARMRAALSARGIRLGPSLWALTGAPPPVRETDTATYVPRQWRFHRGLRGHRQPIQGQLALF
jgi:5'-3' exonuclease